MNSNIFHEQEPDFKQSLRRISKTLDPNFGLLKFIERERQYYDEPKFWYFSAGINDRFTNHDGVNFHTRASGFSFFSLDLALLKCLAESIERYCNYAYYKCHTSFTGSLRELQKSGKAALEPDHFARFSEKQLASSSFKRFAITDSSVLNWTSCCSLPDQRGALIPCQVVYLSYQPRPNEPILYPSISTGVAGGSCLSAALVRGICEIIERDAFMIYYLNKLPAPHIQLSVIRDNRIQQLLDTAKRYKMNIVSLDITTDIPVPVVASIVLDNTGIGKAVSVGIKADFDPVAAIIGSISEAFHTRGWVRAAYEKKPRNVTPGELKEDSSLLVRGFLWYPREAMNHLDFWIRSLYKTGLRVKKAGARTSGVQLKYLLELLKKSGYTVFWKDLTLPEFATLGYHVVKIIIPQFQPLYLNEKYPTLGGQRLYDVPERLRFKRKTEKELNTHPHPFL